MGHHYVPRHYLKHFQLKHRPGFIWMFDKRTGCSCTASIRQVCQQAGFYEAHTELQLAEHVEKPANAIFPRLAAGHPITRKEKMAIAGYLAVMMKRGPYSREKGYKLFPQVRDKTIEEFRRHIQSFIGTPGSNDAILQKRLGELDAIERKYQSEIPAEVTAQIRSPWPTIEMVDLLGAMTWRILKMSGPSFFITCDNPVFFNEFFGLKNSGADVCFPLSSSAALHCSWKDNVVDMESFSASQSTVKEINRDWRARLHGLLSTMRTLCGSPLC